MARILATPVVCALVLVEAPGAGIAAFVIFGIAALTDWADGWLARRRDEVSPLGVFMDLTADKVLVAGVLVAMVEVGLLPTWMVATIVVRELVISGVRQVAAAADVVIPARALGKSKTATTLVGQAIGAGERELCRKAAARVTYAALAVNALMAFVYLAFPAQLISFFTTAADAGRLTP